MQELLSRIEQSFLCGDLATAQHLIVELQSRSFPAPELARCEPAVRRLRSVIRKCRARDRMLCAVFFANSTGALNA
ncbi:MAG: hypothetical protein NVS9B15_23690 [Acidobacteriaceae bacterium]